MPKVKISIDQNECIGCSFCENTCPDFFKYDQSEYKGKLKEGGELKTEITADLTDEQLALAKEAAEGCPAQAIKITPL